MRVSIRHVGLIGMLAVLVLSLQPRVGFSQAAGNPTATAEPRVIPRLTDGKPDLTASGSGLLADGETKLADGLSPRK